MDTPTRIKVLGRVLERFRASLDIHHASLLLYLAEHGPMCMTELARLLGMPLCTTGNWVSLLSNRGFKGTPGFDLIEVKENWLNRRKVLISLNPKGERYLASTIALVGRIHPPVAGTAVTSKPSRKATRKATRTTRTTRTTRITSKKKRKPTHDGR